MVWSVYKSAATSNTCYRVIVFLAVMVFVSESANPALHHKFSYLNAHVGNLKHMGKRGAGAGGTLLRKDALLSM